jgi:hypothetical protein
MGEPRVVTPFLNVTVPVGAVTPDPNTVAVKVTDCPTLLGLSEELIVVVDDAASALLALPAIRDAKEMASAARTRVFKTDAKFFVTLAPQHAGKRLTGKHDWRCPPSNTARPCPTALFELT